MATLIALAGQAALAAEPPAMTVAGRFGVNASGEATYTVPIIVPPGTAGLMPSLSLNYSSQSGNGILGFGWSLGGLPSIARCPRTQAQDGIHGSVNYDSNDRFCLDGRRLLVINGGAYGQDGTEYRTEIESFSKIVAHGAQGNGPAWFEVHTKTGQLLELGNVTGNDSHSQILAQGKTTVRVWAVDKISDTAGNYLTVSYVNDAANGQYYPDHILYTGNSGAAVSPYNSVYFGYIDRNDATPLYRAGSLMQTTKLLSHIKTHTNTAGTGAAVTDYQLDYQFGNAPYYQLKQVRRCDGTGNCLAPTTFGWQTAATWPTRIAVDSTPTIPNDSAMIQWDIADFNGDGRPDGEGDSKVFPSGCTPLYFGNGTDWALAEMAESYGDIVSQPACLQYSAFTPVGTTLDIDGDGLSDMTAYELAPHGCFCIVRNDGHGHFAQWGPDNIMVSFAGAAGIRDFNGDGLVDFILYTKTPGLLTSRFNNDDTTFSTSVVSVPGDATETAAAAGDVDGDGCEDIRFQGVTTSEIRLSCNPAVPSIPFPYYPAYGGYSTSFVPGDFNGDGLDDYVTLTNPSGPPGVLHLSTGTSFIETPLPDFNVGYPTAQYFRGDFDGDGKIDVIKVDPLHMYVYAWANGTLALALTVNVKLPQPNCPDDGHCSDQAYVGSLQTTDVDGDGCTDLVVDQQDLIPHHWYYKFGCHPPLLMTSISNGLGATTNVAYDRLNNNQPFYTKCPNDPSSYQCADQYPTQAVDGPIYVVSQVDTSNGVGGTFTSTYAYAGGKNDLAGRGFLGFQKVTVTDQQSHVVRTTTYNTIFPLTGTVLEDTRSLGSTVLGDTVNSYATIPVAPVRGQPTFVYLATSTTGSREVDGSALPTATTANTNPDAYGDIQTISMSVSDGSSKLTQNAFVNDAARWLLGRLVSTTVTSSVGSSVITRTSSFAYDTATGILTRETIEPNAAACNGTGDSCKLQTDYVLDPFGHRRTATVSGPGIATRASSIAYDANGAFATRTANALDQAESFDFTGPQGAAFGVPTGLTDLNGDLTTVAYDGFGRRVLTTLPFADGTKSAVTYNYCAGVNGGAAGCPTGAAFVVQVAPYAHDGATQDGPAARTFYDILGRAIASDVQGFDGAGTGCTLSAPCWIRTQTVYDATGFVAKTSRPYFVNGGAPRWMVNDYGASPDPYGRPLLVTAPDGSQTHYAYTGLGNQGSQVSVTDALGHATVTKRNAQGLVAAVVDALGKNVSYIYDSYDNLLLVSDPVGNQVVSTYDVRGHKLATSDPDMGLWRYSYDVLGEVLTQTDAKNQTTSFVKADGTPGYDLLGRPVRRVESDLTGTWTYDTAANGIGMLASASGTAAGYSRTLLYDTHARPRKVTLAVNGVNHVYSATYNSDGRLDTLAYPDGLVVKYVYTQLGYLQQLKDNAGGAVLWTANARDAELHLTDQSAGNSDRTIQVYDSSTGRVQQIRASRNGADDGGVAHYDYGFDAIGNLTSRSDAFGAGEAFCYDPLDRLTNYSVGGASCSAGTLTKSVSYNETGSIVSKSDLANGGSGVYSYPAAGAAHPHGVASISGIVDGVLYPKYKYDNNGNLICTYTGATCAGSNISLETDAWTSFNMVSRISQGTTSVAFTYDAEHARIVQRSVDGSSIADTTYLSDPMSGALSEKFVSGGVTTWRDYVTADGRLVGERSCSGGAPCSAGASWQFFVTDHLGSVAAVTDGALGSPTYGQFVRRMSFDPWGRQRNLDGSDDPTCSLGLSNPTTRGFTGHEAIASLCLINMNARVYDPTIARFASPDSIVPDPNDAQSYNRYSYVGNRPLSLTDPTGHLGGPPCTGLGCFGDGPGQAPHDDMRCMGDCSGGYSGVGSMSSGVVFAFGANVSAGRSSGNPNVAVNANGESTLDTNKATVDENGIVPGIASALLNCDPKTVEQTGAAQNAAGVETVIVEASRLPYTYSGPLDAADQSAARAWAEDQLTDGTHLRLHSINNETGFGVSANGTVKVPSKHVCVACMDGKHEGTVFDYSEIENGSYPGHAHTLRQGRLPGPNDTSGVDSFRRGYVLTPQGAFAVERPASEYVVRQIIGDPFNGGQIEKLDQTIHQWNQPGGAGCHVSLSSC